MGASHWYSQTCPSNPYSTPESPPNRLGPPNRYCAALDTRLNSNVRLSSDQGPCLSSMRRPSSQYHKAFMARCRMPKCTSIGVNSRHH
ncbi:hypothetical protein D3C77_690730 [compost metagenome]